MSAEVPEPLFLAQCRMPMNRASIPLTAVPQPKTPSPAAPAPHARAARPSLVRSLDARLMLLLIFWVALVFEPQLWAVSRGLDPAGKIPTVLGGLLVIVLLMRPPARGWSAPLLSYTAFITLTMPFAVNRASAFDPIKAMLIFNVLAVATLGWVKDARVARPILLMLFVGQFLWWGILGVVHGRVDWHPNLANFDGYGPMMVMGIGMAFYFGLATRERRIRWLAFLAAGLSVAGVVGSFARGAELSALSVLGYIWLRWPRKLKATLAIIAASVIVVITASFLSNVVRGGDNDSPQGFWADALTVTNEFDESKGGSSNDRRMLWSAADEIFRQHPILGVGVGNFGPAAAQLPGQVFLKWNLENPATLWARALHSSYYQVLCEGGLVGCALYLWLVIDFVRRNRAIRSRRALHYWATTTAAEFDLRYLSWGLEAGFIGFLGCALFYNQLYVHWFYTLSIVNALLYQLSRPSPRTAMHARAV